jgi:hypothetical protein
VRVSEWAGSRVKSDRVSHTIIKISSIRLVLQVRGWGVMHNSIPSFHRHVDASDSTTKLYAVVPIECVPKKRSCLSPLGLVFYAFYEPNSS